MYLAHKNSLDYHLRNTLHEFGEGGRRLVPPPNQRRLVSPPKQRSTIDSLLDVYAKSHVSQSGRSHDRQLGESSRQSLSEAKTKLTSNSRGSIVSKSRDSEDEKCRPSSSAINSRQHSLPRVTSGSRINIVAVLEFASREYEAIFYDFQSVGGERRQASTCMRNHFSAS